MRSKPQTPRGTYLVSMHVEMPREANIIFVGQPLDPKGGRSRPLGPPSPLRYFKLPMVNLGRPPLPPNRPYH
jgi:hypothetical protein